MRRSIDEIMNGIEERSRKELSKKRFRKKAFALGAVAVLLTAAICIGFAITPYGEIKDEGSKVIENHSTEQSKAGYIDAEQSKAGYIDTVDKSRYLPLAQLSANLTEGVSANSVDGKVIDEAFIKAYSSFGIKLFQNTYQSGDNALSSPLSAMLALAMVTNGAVGDTKTQMETALGGIDAATLNEYLYTLSAYLQEDGTLKSANSIWVTDDDRFLVNADFLQTNANYYAADLYKAAFDEQTVKDVNSWAEEKTDGMIKKIVEEYSPATVMQLINAITFDAEWLNKAEYCDEGVFNNADGTQSKADFMGFNYESEYISTENAKGVIKDYKGGRYSFAILMPNKDIAIDDYIASLDGESFMAAINSAEDAEVRLTMPKFKYNCSMNLIPTLKTLGMTDAFDPSSANLSALGVSESGNVYISSVTQDTFIEVSELGTRAAAVTSVIAEDDCVYEGYTLYVDRPFVYAIIDTATGIPLFTGAVSNLQ